MIWGIASDILPQNYFIWCLLTCLRSLGLGSRTFSGPSGWFGWCKGLFVPHGATVYLAGASCRGRAQSPAENSWGPPCPRATAPETCWLMREGRKTTGSQGRLWPGRNAAPQECCQGGKLSSQPAAFPSSLLRLLGWFFSISICEKASPVIRRPFNALSELSFTAAGHSRLSAGTPQPGRITP